MEDIFRDYASLVSIFTFLFGLILGNRLAIGRDKRKEFNNYCLPIREYLINGSFGNRPRALDLDRFKMSLNPVDRIRFLSAWGSLIEAHKNAYEPDGMGGSNLIDERLIEKSVKRCIKYTNPK
jgi:hypothetical protein